MTTPDTRPNPDEIRRILAAAADVLFSDGVTDAFLDQWDEETGFLLSLDPAPAIAPHPRRRV
jgi:hypothetical protein